MYFIQYLVYLGRSNGFVANVVQYGHELNVLSKGRMSNLVKCLIQ